MKRTSFAITKSRHFAHVYRKWQLGQKQTSNLIFPSSIAEHCILDPQTTRKDHIYMGFTLNGSFLISYSEPHLRIETPFVDINSNRSTNQVLNLNFSIWKWLRHELRFDSHMIRPSKTDDSSFRNPSVLKLSLQTSIPFFLFDSSEQFEGVSSRVALSSHLLEIPFPNSSSHLMSPDCMESLFMISSVSGHAQEVAHFSISIIYLKSSFDFCGDLFWQHSTIVMQGTLVNPRQYNLASPKNYAWYKDFPALLLNTGSGLVLSFFHTKRNPVEYTPCGVWKDFWRLDEPIDWHILLPIDECLQGSFFYFNVEEYLANSINTGKVLPMIHQKVRLIDYFIDLFPSIVAPKESVIFSLTVHISADNISKSENLPSKIPSNLPSSLPSKIPSTSYLRIVYVLAVGLFDGTVRILFVQKPSLINRSTNHLIDPLIGSFLKKCSGDVNSLINKLKDYDCSSGTLSKKCLAHPFLNLTIGK